MGAKLDLEIGIMVWKFEATLVLVLYCTIESSTRWWQLVREKKVPRSQNPVDVSYHGKGTTCIIKGLIEPPRVEGMLYT